MKNQNMLSVQDVNNNVENESNKFYLSFLPSLNSFN